MMKTRWSFALLTAVSLVSMAGCPQKAKPADNTATIAKLEDIRDQMCKCADKACTDKVNEEYAKWGQEQAKAASGDRPAPTAEDATKTSKVMEEITLCTAKAISGPGAAPAGAPATPTAPAAGATPADPAAAGSGSAAAGSAAAGSAAPPR